MSVVRWLHQPGDCALSGTPEHPRRFHDRGLDRPSGVFLGLVRCRRPRPRQTRRISPGHGSPGPDRPGGMPRWTVGGSDDEQRRGASEMDLRDCDVSKREGFCDLLGRSPGGFRIRDRGGPGCAWIWTCSSAWPRRRATPGRASERSPKRSARTWSSAASLTKCAFRPGSGRVGDTLGLSGVPTRRFVAPELLGLARWADERQGFRGGLYETSVQSGMGRHVAGGGPCRHCRNV